MGITSYLVNRIQKSAEEYKGHCTHTFSQTLEPVSSMIGKSKKTKDGICQALSEMWIVFHAHDGSIWNWLCPDGKVNSSALANVAYNFNYGTSMFEGKGSAITDQDQNSDLWFLQYGIRRRTDMKMSKVNMSVGGKLQKVNVANRATASADRGGGSRMGQGKALGNALISGSMVKNMGLGDGTYRMIGIHGSVGGHCMCAFVGQDVCFFDPNFGEFYFPKRDDFAKWFGDYFWPKSFYDWALSNKFELRDYARAVGAGAKNFSGKF